MRGNLSLIVVVIALVAGSVPAVAEENGYYTNREGHSVHRPTHAHHAPRGATAHCRDGTYSFSENHRGTCSHHGGVAEWLN